METKVAKNIFDMNAIYRDPGFRETTEGRYWVEMELKLKLLAGSIDVVCSQTMPFQTQAYVYMFDQRPRILHSCYRKQ